MELGFVQTLKSRLLEAKPLIQVVIGPRQVGKTTGVKQALALLGSTPSRYVSADDLLSPSRDWLYEQWALAKADGAILVIDEVQKVDQWSEMIKKLWDEEAKARQRLKVVLLGSSSLELQSGLSESLTGRFELIRVYHWSYAESQAAFGMDLSSYLRFGGYPGATPYVQDPARWYAYIKDSVVETVINRDILRLRTVSKPALFRQAFELLCAFPAQEISYRKLLGQLHDKGNTDTIKHYIELYEGALLIRALQKFSTNVLRKKSSSPKILPLCPALVTFAWGISQELDAEDKGRLLELAVGTDLNRLTGELYYWREGNDEVDYVLRQGRKLFAIEVKSGKKQETKGLAAFKENFPESRLVVIDQPLYPQFSADPMRFLERF